MFLVDWALANFLMAGMTLALFGIAVVTLFIAFTRKKGAADSKEKYLQERSESEPEVKAS